MNDDVTPSTVLPDVRRLPQLRVGEPRLAGHCPGRRHHGVEGVLGEVLVSARPGERRVTREAHVRLCTHLTGVTAVCLTGPASALGT